MAARLGMAGMPSTTVEAAARARAATFAQEARVRKRALRESASPCPRTPGPGSEGTPRVAGCRHLAPLFQGSRARREAHAASGPCAGGTSCCKAAGTAAGSQVWRSNPTRPVALGVASSNATGNRQSRPTRGTSTRIADYVPSSGRVGGLDSRAQNVRLWSRITSQMGGRINDDAAVDHPVFREPGKIKRSARRGAV